MPWEPLRYLIPLLPLVLALAALAFESAALRVAGRNAPDGEIVRRRMRLARSLALGVGLVACAIGLGREALTYRPAAVPEYVQWSAPWRDWQGFAETIDWLRAHTRPEDVVASPLDPFYYLHTGRRGVRYWFHNPQTYFYPAHAAPQLGSVAEIAPELRRLGVRWLIREPALQDFYAESAAADALALSSSPRRSPAVGSSFAAATPVTSSTGSTGPARPTALPGRESRPWRARAPPRSRLPAGRELARRRRATPEGRARRRRNRRRCRRAGARRCSAASAVRSPSGRAPGGR
jgi:hypothetical protein